MRFNPQFPRQVFVVHALGDEMNKTRAAITRLATALTPLEIGVTALDPFGTGDSDGEFAEAHYDIWLDDYHALLEATPACKTVLSVRAGGPLAHLLAQQHPQIDTSIAWHPEKSLSRALQSLLRTRATAARLAGEPEKVEELVARLEDGATVEAAGYDISPQLWASAARVDQLVRDLPNHDHQHMALWTGPVKPMHAPETDYFVAGEQFWNTAEIVIPEPFIEHTVSLLS